MPDYPLARRRNGLDRPYAVAQIAAVTAMVASILQFSAIVAPLLRPTSAIAPVLLLFYATVAVVLQAASATILTDPIDPHLCRHLQQQQQSNHGDGASSSSVTPVTTSTTVWRNPLHQPPIITPPLSSNTNTNKRKRIGLVDRLYYRANVYRQSLPPPVYSTAEDNTQQRQQAPTMKHCWICDVTVSAQSMHCKFCNKCVANFDHHCMWLNTCVGQANYTSFYRTLLSLCAMEIIHFTVQLSLLVDIIRNNSETQVVENSWIRHPELVLVLLVFFMIFNAFSLALIGQLIVFHMSLQRNNLTTYEFIVRDHQLKRAVARREGDIEAHRVVRMAEAQRDGHKLAAWRLQMGGLCRQSGLVLCDPMDLPEIPGEPDPEAGFSQVLGNNTVKESNIDEGEEDEDDDDNNDEANSGHMQLSAHSSVAIYGTSSHNMSTNGEDNKKPEDGKTSDYINGESTYSSDQPLVDLMYEAGLTHGSVNQNEGPAIAVEDLDDPSSNDNDDSLEVDVDETTLVGSPLRNRELSPVAADSSEPNQPEEHDEEDDEVYEGIEAEMFDNEPDDVSYTSGCSGHSNRSPRKGNALGERDYTAF